MNIAADEWRFHRKNLNPSFYYNVVKSFYPIFNKNLKIFTKNLRKYAATGSLRLQPLIYSCAMDMICGKSALHAFIFYFSLLVLIDIHDFCFYKSFFLFLETTLGIDIQSQNEEHSEFLHKVHHILDITARRFFQPWIQPAFLFRLSKYAKPYYSSVEYLNKRLADVSTCKTNSGYSARNVLPRNYICHLSSISLLVIRIEKGRIRNRFIIIEK